MNRVILTSATVLAASTAAALAGGLAPPIQPLATVQTFVAPSNCATVQPVVSALQAQGFSRIEVDTGLTQARFTAMRGNDMNTFIYDCNSGALLGQNAGSVTASLEPGVVNVGEDDDNDFVQAAAGGNGANVGAGGGTEADAGAGTDGGTDAGADAGAGADVRVDGDTPVSSDGSVGVDAETGGDNGFGNGDDVALGGSSLPNNGTENDQGF